MMMEMARRIEGFKTMKRVFAFGLGWMSLNLFQILLKL